jgi:hypothetical protein
MNEHNFNTVVASPGIHGNVEYNPSCQIKSTMTSLFNSYLKYQCKMFR